MAEGAEDFPDSAVRDRDRRSGCWQIYTEIGLYGNNQADCEASEEDQPCSGKQESESRTHMSLEYEEPYLRGTVAVARVMWILHGKMPEQNSHRSIWKAMVQGLRDMFQRIHGKKSKDCEGTVASDRSRSQILRKLVDVINARMFRCLIRNSRNFWKKRIL